MPDVHLRPITHDNLSECLALKTRDDQAGLVATNAKSLAEAYVNPSLVPLAIYDGAARGYETTDRPMLGFTVYELAAGVGFLLRLMIAAEHQGQGYGRAATLEVIRRLRLHPETEMIATSCLRTNTAAERLYRRLGFVEWDTSWAADSDELFLRLP